MGEYVININWSSGGREKSKTTPTAFLAGAAATAIAANTLFKNQADSSGLAETLHKGAVEPKDKPPVEFFFGRKNYYQDVLESENIETGEKRTQYSDIYSQITLYKRTIVYSAAQALRLINLGFSTHYQYASAIASSTAELNAVNEYQNTMTGLGIVGSIAAGAAVGAKVGSIGGPVGMIAGAVAGTAVATINKAVGT